MGLTAALPLAPGSQSACPSRHALTLVKPLLGDREPPLILGHGRKLFPDLLGLTLEPLVLVQLLDYLQSFVTIRRVYDSLSVGFRQPLEPGSVALHYAPQTFLCNRVRFVELPVELA